MFSTFEVVPAVDVQDEQVVQLVGGERGTGATYGDPLEAAEEWVAAGTTSKVENMVESAAGRHKSVAPVWADLVEDVRTEASPRTARLRGSLPVR